MKEKKFADMSESDLKITVDELRRELFKLRLNSATSSVKALSSTKNKLKRDIARSLTFLRQKELNRKGV